MDIEHAKNCPFCGSSDVGLSKLSNGHYYVTCFECDTDGPIGSCNSEAVERWNERSDDNDNS